MSPIRRRRALAGLLLGLGPASLAAGQDLPPALPPALPPPPGGFDGPAPAPLDDPALARPRPPVVLVPPGGIAPTWAPGPIDPAALGRHPPQFVRAKSRSWHWRKLQGKLLGYPEEFEPRPLGAALYDGGRIMVANAAAARLVLHEYDFLPGSAGLTTRGGDQLAALAAQLGASPYPLVVERTPGDPSLAEARRLAVLAVLARGPVPVPPERVVVGVPAAHGMAGVDAYFIGINATERTRAYGPPIPINSNGVNSPSGVTGPSPGGAGSQ